MVPADEGLHASDLARAQIDLGLKVQQQLIIDEGIIERLYRGAVQGRECRPRSDRRGDRCVWP